MHFEEYNPACKIWVWVNAYPFKNIKRNSAVKTTCDFLNLMGFIFLFLNFTRTKTLGVLLIY
jgi:hypothetical protein